MPVRLDNIAFRFWFHLNQISKVDLFSKDYFISYIWTIHLFQEKKKQMTYFNAICDWWFENNNVLLVKKRPPENKSFKIRSLGQLNDVKFIKRLKNVKHKIWVKYNIVNVKKYNNFFKLLKNLYKIHNKNWFGKFPYFLKPAFLNYLSLLRAF